MGTMAHDAGATFQTMKRGVGKGEALDPQAWVRHSWGKHAGRGQGPSGF